jgi:hypothetical protein
MGLPITEYVVDGRDYKTTLLPATQALVLMPKIIALLGKEITTLVLASGEDGLQQLLSNPEILASMLHTISKNAAESNGLLLLHEIVRHTSCKQVQMASGLMEAPLYEAFDGHFAGDHTHLFKVCIFAARASFTKPSPGK